MVELLVLKGPSYFLWVRLVLFLHDNFTDVKPTSFGMESLPRCGIIITNALIMIHLTSSCYLLELTESLLAMCIMRYLVEQSFKFIYKVLLRKASK